MDKRILILGNGFDLDLGLKTRYIDFADSKEWDDLYSDNLGYKWSRTGLGRYLKNRREDKPWFDIEKIISDYVCNRERVQSFANVPEDRLFLGLLKQQLAKYLQRTEVWENYRKKSLAYSLLDRFQCFHTVYSFNYTDYTTISTLSMENFREYPNLKHVHNYGRNMILGIGEEGCNSQEYSFFKKSNQEWHSTNLIPDLKASDFIVFFGHSINSIDMYYFKRFFLNCCEEPMRDTKRHIIFIAKDSDSIINIKNNIQNTGVSLTEFASLCHVDFLATDDYYLGFVEAKEVVKKLYDIVSTNI